MRLVLAAVLGLVVLACGDGNGEDASPTAPPTTPPTTVPTATATSEPFDGRTVRVAFTSIGEQDDRPRMLVYEFPGARALSWGEGNAFGRVDWSHDGDYLAALGLSADDELCLWIYDDEGEELADLPAAAMSSADPAWAPDADFLAAITDAVVVLDPNGEPVAELPIPPTVEGSSIQPGFSWSPTGERVAVVIGQELLVLGVDGETATVGLSELWTDSSVTVRRPYWDAESNLVLHSSEALQPMRSHVVDVESGSLTESGLDAEQIEAELDEAFLRLRPRPKDEVAEAAAAVAPAGAQGFGIVGFDDGNGLAGVYATSGESRGTLVVAWRDHVESIEVAPNTVSLMAMRMMDAVLLPEGGDE